MSEQVAEAGMTPTTSTGQQPAGVSTAAAAPGQPPGSQAEWKGTRVASSGGYGEGGREMAGGPRGGGGSVCVT